MSFSQISFQLGSYLNEGQGNTRSSALAYITNKTSNTYHVHLVSNPSFVTTVNNSMVILPGDYVSVSIHYVFPEFNGTYSGDVKLRFVERVVGSTPTEETRSVSMTIKTKNLTIQTPSTFSMRQNISKDTSLDCNWASSSGGDGGFSHYKIYINDSDIPIVQTTNNSYTFRELSYSTIYQACVTAVDKRGNESRESMIATVTTPCEIPEINTFNSPRTLGGVIEARSKVTLASGFSYKSMGQSKLLVTISTCPLPDYPLRKRSLTGLGGNILMSNTIPFGEIHEEEDKTSLFSTNSKIISNVSDDSLLKLIQVYSISGQLVYQKDNPDSNFNIKNVSLPNGVYILEKIDKNGKITRDKVILNR